MSFEIDGLTLAVGAISLLIVIMLVQSTRRFEDDLKKNVREMEKKAQDIEESVLSAKSDVEKLRKETGEKIDYTYLDKRIDGLIGLIKRH